MRPRLRDLRFRRGKWRTKAEWTPKARKTLHYRRTYLFGGRVWTPLVRIVEAPAPGPRVPRSQDFWRRSLDRAHAIDTALLKRQVEERRDALRKELSGGA